MAALFLIFTVAILLMAFGLRRTALIVALINLLLCLGIFWHHITSSANILL